VTRSAPRVNDRLACILLAAGASRRLGRPKQLVRHRGRPLLMLAAKAARRTLPRSPLVVVLGAEPARLRLVLARARWRARAVVNARWREGMATSLRAGLAALGRRVQAALVLTVDQPAVDAAALARLVRAWRRKPGIPAAARYEGRPGVPAVLPRRYWRAVKSLRGDEGARALLRGNAAITLVDMPEAALDVDTPADLERLAALSRPPASRSSPSPWRRSRSALSSRSARGPSSRR
jgi:CTP:molybdopterin cytidylyltransferase MocA